MGSYVLSRSLLGETLVGCTSVYMNSCVSLAQEGVARHDGMALKYGKHTGAPYEKVAAEDRKYCAWVLREERESNNQLSHNMKSFAHYLKTQHGGVMTVGKHSGKFFDELLKEDPEYAVWVQSLTQPGAAMKEFSEYITEQQQRKEDDDNRKRTRDEAANGKCILCLDRALTAAYIPCGHTVSVDGQNCYGDDQAPTVPVRLQKHGFACKLVAHH